jgi:hypothetical protein
VLYHFSDQGDIERFAPRPPLAHPATEPFVFAIDAWHAPLYFFPRDVPRTGIWPIESTTAEDRSAFAQAFGGARMALLVPAEFAVAWRTGHVFRYFFAPNETWLDTGDHGCWVSREAQTPISVERLSNLPALCAAERVLAQVVEDLPGLTARWRATTLHVSAVRHRLLSGYPGAGGTPVRPAGGR